MFDIKQELKKLPDHPGVYLMKDDKNEIIYVGKAISLKKRVRQYFQSSKNMLLKVCVMVSKISEFEYILTDNEVEALILESNFIKEYRPRYNILLKDDKQYPYIKVTTNEEYPRIFKTRTVKKDKARYFGPYTNAGAVNVTLEIINKVFPIRNCRQRLTKDKLNNRPCLNYHIKKCLAPCAGKISHEDYMKMIDEILVFLSGKKRALIDMLKKNMKQAAANLDFEQAAKYRDKLALIEHMFEKQKVLSSDLEDKDIIGLAKNEHEACIQLFFVREGKIIGREHYLLSNIQDNTDSEILNSFIKQFYTGAWYIPKEILVQEDIDEQDIIEVWLSEKKEQKVSIKTPKRGEKNQLMKLVKVNAIQVLKQNSEKMLKKFKSNKEGINELAELLKFEEAPGRIEAYDISNIQGTQSVASMIVFENGIKKTSNYKRFKIKTVEGPNDYDSMYEVLYRRFSRGEKEKKSIKDIKKGTFSIYPDLIMVDGGKGQINVAKKVFKALNIDIPVCGLVKDDYHNTRGIIYENKEICIEKSSEVFKLITEIQNEAHRFAISYHRNLRGKEMFKSILDDISGIGEKRKKSLLASFGSIDNIRKASVDELANAKGMNTKAAKEVYNFFRQKRNY
ncbi:excinuclease ABC subunit UvrC [Abyssisolibacter fermentans]|uniref:excinuclease ABC subunit UvrC n=1 Tax=Abyssisolibacter fermentans TaxID=1766203 RepID=UPI00082FFB69|nr:excinuclease ABC subunit UvrC [Abyssisolibacter fermentans]